MPTLEAFEENVKDPWERLIEAKKVVKDPVHKDISLTQTEVKIIDTKQFQRLRYIKQLGPAIFVYPGAQHSRFEHSIGTMYMAQRIIYAINKNAKKGYSAPLKNRDTFLIRLVALLHDLVHLPFGHTIEDEGRLFKPKQWMDTERHDIFFYPEISSKISQSIIEAFKDCGLKENGEAEKLLEELKNILVAEEAEKIDELINPHIADIVGNTICADLLDYLKRDIYFTGITGEYDERVISYFTLGKVEEKDRVVIKLFKDKKGKEKEDKEIRRDVLSALVELLRLRYSLAEKVYYHHAKREASAMVIKMVACGIKSGLIDKRKLCDLNDTSLIHFIIEKEMMDSISADNKKHWQAAKSLAEMLTRRELYKPVYEQRIIDVQNKSRIEEVRDSWEKRHLMEEAIEKLVGLDEGDIIIYIPKEDMSAKQARVLVQLPNNKICRLNEFGSAKRLPAGGYKELSEIISDELNTLRKKHESLWKLSVFTREEHLKNQSKRSLIEGICQQWFEGQAPVTVADIIIRKQGISASATQIAGLACGSIGTRPSSGFSGEPLFSNYVKIIDELVKKGEKDAR